MDVIVKYISAHNCLFWKLFVKNPVVMRFFNAIEYIDAQPADLCKLLIVSCGELDLAVSSIPQNTKYFGLWNSTDKTLSVEMFTRSWNILRTAAIADNFSSPPNCHLFWDCPIQRMNLTFHPLLAHSLALMHPPIRQPHHHEGVLNNKIYSLLDLIKLFRTAQTWPYRMHACFTTCKHSWRRDAISAEGVF